MYKNLPPKTLPFSSRSPQIRRLPPLSLSNSSSLPRLSLPSFPSLTLPRWPAQIRSSRTACADQIRPIGSSGLRGSSVFSAPHAVTRSRLLPPLCSICSPPLPQQTKRRPPPDLLREQPRPIAALARRYPDPPRLPVAPSPHSLSLLEI
jgi:hypothetical protein